MRYSIPLRRQRGATLLISLIMLVVLTLFAVAGFNLSSVNLRIAGNYQDQRFNEAIVYQAIEQVLSTSAAFSLTAAAQTVCVNGGTPPSCTGGYAVSVTAAKCNYSAPASGYSLKEDTLVPDDNDWEITASYTDASTNATATTTQGVRIRMLAGNCPA
jgi:Tfp pilus assembly protein PilX